MSPSPSSTYASTLATLNATRASFLDPAFQESLDSATPEVRLAASRELLQVQQAILTLSNAQLSSIAAQMAENEKDLNATTKSLSQALEDLTNVVAILDAASALVKVVAKVIPLL